jgi:hypothetical protein
MPSSSWFIMWQCRTKRPVKSLNRERKVTFPFRGTTTVSCQLGSISFLPLIATISNGLGVNVEDMIVIVLIDDGPPLDRA